MSSPQSFNPVGVFLVDVLGSASPLKVPEYQRDYSWDTTHVRAFWDDLLWFARATIRARGPSEYFLGTIVLVNAGDHQEILDGQQRLATATILLAVIRDRLRELDSRLAARIHSFIVLDNLLVRAATPVYRLELNYFDGGFFRRVIQDEDRSALPRPERASHKRILFARRTLEQLVNEHLQGLKSVKEVAEELANLATLLTHRFSLVRITSSDEDQAAFVFETLNDRGTSLRTEDLLRSYLLSKAPKVARREITRLWDQISASVKGPGIESLIRTSWVAAHGDVKSRALYKEIKDHLIAERTAHLDYVQGLARDAAYLKKLANGTVDNEVVKQAAMDLSHLKADKAHSALLAAHNCGMSSSDSARLAKALVALVIRHNWICKFEPSKLEAAVTECARLISAGTALDTAVQPLRAISPSNDEVAAAFRRLSFKSKKPARVILCGLEALKHRTRETNIAPPSRVHVEHVLPLTPKSGQKVRDHDKVVHRLGNLTLFDGPRNSGLSNSAFGKKKKKYVESEILITREIAANFSKWGPKAIRLRQESMLHDVNRAWPHTLLLS